MNQTTTTTTTITHPVNDLEALRLQLKEDGKDYCDYRNRNSNEIHERLLQTLQTNDCREIITAVVDGDVLANTFVAAAFRNHVDILEVFLNHGMKIDIKNRDGYTALIGASCNGDEQCVKLLFDCHASVDVQNKKGDTALIIASHGGNTKVVEILLEKNANPDLQNNLGMTALMSSSVRSHKKVVQVLLNHSADIELKNEDGKTALDFAKNNEIKEMIRNHVINTSFVLK